MKTGFTDVVKTLLGESTLACSELKDATELRPARRRPWLERAVLALAVAGSCFAGMARAEELKPYKDALFAYPRLLQSDDGDACRLGQISRPA